ncbi:stress protein, Gls24 family [Embleya scabrispora]|uniref:Stress protein, Gls24 family n=1 Tax=Embleya scabrispora TaxID=159449 RepID=A0A1T3NN01_9ACTN|nr:stress protein, Gls24 family [Embleya scabrispora]
MPESKNVTDTPALVPELAGGARLAPSGPDRSPQTVEPTAAGTRGRTAIADGVIAKITGVAAREIEGVHALGGSVARALDAVRQRVPGGRPNVAHGVSVEVGERQCALDLNLVVEYGVPIAELGQAVRRNVIATVERMTGLEVVEVNVAVDDIHLPDDEPTSTRVA